MRLVGAVPGRPVRSARATEIGSIPITRHADLVTRGNLSAMRLAPGFTAVALLAACASPGRPIDRTRPLEIDRHWGSTTFKQDGVRVDDVDLISALTSTPAGREQFRSANRSAVTSFGMLLAGVGLVVGAVVVDDGKVSTGLAVAGLGACGGSLYFSHRAQSSIDAAAREYNASLPAAPAASAPRSRGATAGASVSLDF